MTRISQLLLTFLLNACWQIVLVAVVATICARLLRCAPARQRHALWVAALALSFCLPLFSTGFLRATTNSESPQPQASRQVIAETVTLPPAQMPEQAAASDDVPPRLRLGEKLAAALLISYLLFLCYRAAWLLGAWRKTRALTNGARPAAIPPHAQVIVRRYQQALAARQVEILCSAAVAVPVTVGATRPLIIVPEQLLQERDAEVWAAAIGHELAHIKRRDYARNLLYELLQLPLSFHPAVALMRRRIIETRELACDELVTERLLSARAYARSLMRLACSIPALGHHTATTTLGIIGADTLEERIMTLLGSKPQLSLRRKRMLLLTAAVLVAVSCLAATTFALRIGVDRWDTSPAAAQEKKQETERTEAQAREERKKREIEEREKKERDGATTPAEREARAKREAAEQEARVKTVKEVKLTMAQAIQIATDRQPGTVVECNLAREGEQPVYRLKVLAGDWPDSTITIMTISGLDGQILKAKTEHLTERP